MTEPPPRDAYNYTAEPGVLNLDGTFLLFDSAASQLFNYITNIHANIQLSFEGEQKKKYIEISRCNGTI